MLRSIYNRLFLERILAIVTRLETAIAELDLLRIEVRELRAEQADLERHVRTMIGSQIELAAVTRRLAALEDELERRERAEHGSGG